jgi:hypothetical protein
MTWYLEDKSIWAAAMAMSLAFVHVNILLPLNKNECHRLKLFSISVFFRFFVGRECSFGNHPYASTTTGRESHVS